MLCVICHVVVLDLKVDFKDYSNSANYGVLWSKCDEKNVYIAWVIGLILINGICRRLL